jgi:hypothetical protein
MINYVENHLGSIEKRQNPVVQLLRKSQPGGLGRHIDFFFVDTISLVTLILR